MFTKSTFLFQGISNCEKCITYSQRTNDRLKLKDHWILYLWFHFWKGFWSKCWSFWARYRLELATGSSRSLFTFLPIHRFCPLVFTLLCFNLEFQWNSCYWNVTILHLQEGKLCMCMHVFEYPVFHSTVSLIHLNLPSFPYWDAIPRTELRRKYSHIGKYELATGGFRVIERWITVNSLGFSATSSEKHSWKTKS